ncbi:hypothetical protein OG589_25200 [Sphaerisporangium sp. NBC_01403]|uniref:hypothetical protein n=1 Tax=Sphaerisporangium sp. NBC_01403 TaxID=2903599 RepID=UPI003248D911
MEPVPLPGHHAARSEQIVGALLDLARAEHGIRTTSAVDLADFARDAIAITSAEALRRGVSVVSRLDTAPVTGDPTLLRQLATNLGLTLVIGLPLGTKTPGSQ